MGSLMRFTLSLKKCGMLWAGRKFGLKKNGAKSLPPPRPPRPPPPPALFPSFNVPGRHGLFEERALFTGALGVSGTISLSLPGSGTSPTYRGCRSSPQQWVEELGPGRPAHTAGAPVSRERE